MEMMILTYDFGHQNRIGIRDKSRKRILTGQNVRNNPVPVWTARPEADPFLIITDPNLKKSIGFSKYLLARGVLEIGAAGTGKTNLNLILEDAILKNMESDAIHLIFDPKGDYLEQVIKRVPSKNLFIISSENRYRHISKHWNMFAEIMPRGSDGRLVYTPDCDEIAFELVSSLFQEMESETQPVFPAMAGQLLTALIIYYIGCYWRKQPYRLNNKDFLSFIYAQKGEDIKKILEMKGMEQYRSCANYISGGQSGNQTQGVLSYLNSVLRKVFVGSFAEADSERSFSMREIFQKEQQAVIIIKYDLMRGNTLGPIYKILLDLSLKYSLGVLNGKKRNYYLLIDEWGMVPKLNYMSIALSYGRSQGVKVICGIQNVSAIQKIYGEEEAASIMAGFQTIIGFRVADYASRQYLMNHFGSNYQHYSYVDLNRNIHAQREGYSLEDWEIQSLSCGQAAIYMVDEKPFFFQIPEYIEED